MIPNVGLNWWVNMVGDGWCRAYIRTALSCSLLCHTRLNALGLYKSENVFHVLRKLNTKKQQNS